MSYTMKILAATDTEAEAYEVTFKTNYKNTMAQAASISANMAEEQRDCLKDRKPAGFAQDAIFSGAKALHVIDAWEELADDGNEKAMAKLQASLARECRKMYGFGCKIEGGQLIGTKLGSGKKAKKKTVLVTMIEDFETTCTEVQRAEMETIIAAAVKLYADTAGSTIKA